MANRRLTAAILVAGTQRSNLSASTVAAGEHSSAFEVNISYTAHV